MTPSGGGLQAAVGSLATRVLQHERLLVATLLLGVIAASWAYLLRGAGTLQEMGGMVMPMSSGPWDAGHAAVMLGMWVAMMTAMMLPSAAPMILLFATVAGARAAGGALTTGLFALGYLVVWSGFSGVAVALQYALEKVRLLSPMMEITSVAVAGLLFIAAGAYQWMPLKRACLRHCRSPLEFVVAHWRPGRPGAFRMGLRHGAYCVGCCWVLMMLLFVGGLMNLLWVGALAAFVLAEKLVPGGLWLGRLAGLGLVAWGAWILLSARGWA